MTRSRLGGVCLVGTMASVGILGFVTSVQHPDNQKPFVDKSMLVSSISKRPPSLKLNEAQVSEAMRLWNFDETSQDLASLDNGAQNDTATDAAELAFEDDPGMRDAILQARSTFPRFVELMDTKVVGQYFVRFPSMKNGQTSRYWMEIKGFHEDSFYGNISSKTDDPKTNNSYDSQPGDWVEVQLGLIEDWMVRSNGLIFGAYTMRYLLKDAPFDQAETMKARFRD